MWLIASKSIHMMKIGLRLEILNVVDHAAIGSAPSKDLLIKSKITPKSGS